MSTIKADTLVASDGSSPVTLTKQSAAKAWVNYKGTSTNAVNDSFNLSSMTDVGTGDYDSNITNAFTGDDFASVIGGNESSGIHNRCCTAMTLTSSSFNQITYNSSSDAKSDFAQVNTVCFGDLA